VGIGLVANIGQPLYEYLRRRKATGPIQVS